jgi:cell division protein FtsB
MTAAVRERPRTDVGSGTVVSHRAAPARNNRSRSTTGSKQRPKLKVLNQEAIRQRARRRNALLTLFILVLLGFFAVAFIQAQLVADQQDLDVLRARIAEAEAENARIARDVEIASSPAVIFERATNDLQMVRAYQPVYLEAVAPIRDIPNAPVFDPETEGGFVLAAPQAASVDGISAGISTGAAIKDPASVVAAPLSGAPATDAPVIQAESLQTESVESAPAESVQAAPVESVPATPAITAPAATVSSLGGVVAASDQTVVTDQLPVAATVTPGAVAGAGSIAGSRAVTGGSGSG